MRNAVNNGCVVRCVGKLFKSGEEGERGRGEAGEGEGKWGVGQMRAGEGLEGPKRGSSLFFFFFK